MITVLGATGNTGRRITAQLLESGTPVRAVGRSAPGLAHPASARAEHWVGDLADPTFLTAAMRGADAAYVLMPFDLGEPDYRGSQARVGESIRAALEATEVRTVVALSSLGADVESGTGFIETLYDQEQRLRSLSGVDVLLLRPGVFVESFLPSLEAVRTNGFHADSVDPELAVPMVATRDIADIAADALLTGHWTGVQVREILGPRDLTHVEAAAAIGARIGAPDLPYVHLRYAQMLEVLVDAGLPEGIARLHVEMTRGLNDGTVASRAGRSPATSSPTSFADAIAQLIPGAGAGAGSVDTAADAVVG